MGKIKRLNHIAVAVNNCAQASKVWRILGAAVEEPMDVKEHGVKVVFAGVDNTKIELLEPLGADSPVKNFLEKKPGGGIHHVCFEVDNVQRMVDELNKQGIRPISDKPKIGAAGKPVVFLHPKDCGGVLVELEES